MADFKTAKHTKANAQGVKQERANTKVIPKSKFESVSNMGALVEKLFGAAGGQTLDRPNGI